MSCSPTGETTPLRRHGDAESASRRARLSSVLKWRSRRTASASRDIAPSSAAAPSAATAAVASLSFRLNASTARRVRGPYTPSAVTTSAPSTICSLCCSRATSRSTPSSKPRTTLSKCSDSSCFRWACRSACHVARPTRPHTCSPAWSWKSSTAWAVSGQTRQGGDACGMRSGGSRVTWGVESAADKSHRRSRGQSSKNWLRRSCTATTCAFRSSRHARVAPESPNGRAARAAAARLTTLRLLPRRRRLRRRRRRGGARPAAASPAAAAAAEDRARCPPHRRGGAPPLPPPPRGPPRTRPRSRRSQRVPVRGVAHVVGRAVVCELLPLFTGRFAAGEHRLDDRGVS